MSGEIDATPGITLSEGEPVTAAKLNSLGLPALRVAELSVTSRELADGIITSEKLDPNLEAQLGVEDNSVGTNAFANGAVTGPKFATGQQLRAPLISPISGTTYKPSLLLVNIPWLVNAIPVHTAWAYQIPRQLLDHAGDCLRITSIIASTDTGANTRTFNYFLGAFPVLTVTTSNPDRCYCIQIHMVTLTTTTTQRVHPSMVNNNGFVDVPTPLNEAYDLTLPLNVKLDMEGSGVASVATHYLTTIEYLPAP
jgi:hypothetical protein